MPTLDGTSFFTRKQTYALNMLVVCDPDKRVRYFFMGWPGSVHDNRVWRTCKLNRDQDQFFRPQEYLIGDSAFAVGPCMVPLFKHARGGVMDPAREAFNSIVKTARVKSEHCIGAMKGRFPWMKSIRIHITKESDMRVIIRFVGAIVVLHN